MPGRGRKLDVSGKKEADDLAERRRTGDMLRLSQELIRIDDEIRGLRLAVNVLITREKELKAKRAELEGRGGA